MSECPICKGKGTYYRCYQIALGKLLGSYPSIADGVADWVLLEEGPIATEDEFKSYLSLTDNDLMFRRVRAEEAFLEVGEHGITRFRYKDHWTLKRIHLYEDYLQVHNAQDLFLIVLCRDCATTAKSEVGLERYELYQLTVHQCPCCGYFTRKWPTYYESCGVCYWDGLSDDPDDKAPSGLLLKDAIENYREFGACVEYVRAWVRPPAIDEYPKYHQ